MCLCTCEGLNSSWLFETTKKISDVSTDAWKLPSLFSTPNYISRNGSAPCK